LSKTGKGWVVKGDGRLLWGTLHEESTLISVLIVRRGKRSVKAHAAQEPLPGIKERRVYRSAKTERNYEFNCFKRELRRGEKTKGRASAARIPGGGGAVRLPGGEHTRSLLREKK